MGKITKVVLFDVSALSSSDIEKFQKHIEMFTFLSDIRIDSKMQRISHIRAFFEVDVNIEHLIENFIGVKYKDITGLDQMNP